MNDQPRMSGLDREVPQSAVSIYGQDSGMDDFPVLKAFQQYIDAEQAKARKRIISLGAFFLLLTGAVIAVFVILLIGMSDRNQQLNDRILEYVMRERDRPAAPAAPVVVQQPTQDNSAIMALTSKLEEMKRELDKKRDAEEKAAAERAAAEKAAAEKEKAALERLRRETQEREARARAETEKVRQEESRRNAKLKEELETMRLKALLAAEREKAAKEKERRREAELEAYRRKHYPELYGKKDVNKKTVADKKGVLDDDNAITYFSDEEDDPEPVRKPAAAKPAPVKPAPAKPEAAKPAPAPVPAKPVEPAPRKTSAAPVKETKAPPAAGSSAGLDWSLPES